MRESQVPQEDVKILFPGMEGWMMGRQLTIPSVNGLEGDLYAWSSHSIGRFITLIGEEGAFGSVAIDEIERKAGILLRRVILY